MNITALGKFLVVANFFFSVLVAGWSMAFFFTRVDWTDYPNTPEAPTGFETYVQEKKKEMGDNTPVSPLDREMAYNDPTVGKMLGRVAHLKAMLDQSPAALASSRDGLYQVAEREQFRSADRAFYRNEITLLFDAPETVQLHEVVLGADGQPDLDTPDPKVPSHKLPKFRKVNDRAGQPLRSLIVYQKAYQGNLLALRRARTSWKRVFRKIPI